MLKLSCLALDAEILCLPSFDVCPPEPSIFHSCLYVCSRKAFMDTGHSSVLPLVDDSDRSHMILLQSMATCCSFPQKYFALSIRHCHWAISWHCFYMCFIWYNFGLYNGWPKQVVSSRLFSTLKLLDFV